MKLNKLTPMLRKKNDKKKLKRQDWNLPGKNVFLVWRKKMFTDDVNWWDGKAENGRSNYRAEVFKGKNERRKYMLRCFHKDDSTTICNQELKKTNISLKLIIKT